MQHIGQHALVRADNHALERQRLECVTRGGCFAQGQVGVHPRQIPLCVGVGSTPAALPLVILAQALVGAQAPGSQVHAAVEVQVLAAGIACVAAPALLGRGLVIDEGGIDAVVPQFGVNLADHVSPHGDLRD
ncbi:hypothetical protein D3C86_1400240 [compost metagenome]